MNIICIGRNYVAHAQELNNPVPEEPVIFIKPESALLKNNAPFYYPDFSNDIHYEIELVLRVGKKGANIEHRWAHKYYDGIGIGIDFTARDLQNKAKQKGLPWTIAKGFMGSAPVSDFINKKIIKNLKDLNFSLYVNNEVKQKGNSSMMIWNFESLIVYISKFIHLRKGDLIFTGTPQGVGPIKKGDLITGYLESKKLMEFSVK